MLSSKYPHQEISSGQNHGCLRDIGIPTLLPLSDIKAGWILDKLLKLDVIQITFRDPRLPLRHGKYSRGGQGVVQRYPAESPLR